MCSAPRSRPGGDSPEPAALTLENPNGQVQRSRDLAAWDYELVRIDVFTRVARTTAGSHLVRLAPKRFQTLRASAVPLVELVAHRVLLVVVLVIRLGREEGAGRRNLGRDGLAEL